MFHTTELCEDAFVQQFEGGDDPAAPADDEQPLNQEPGDVEIEEQMIDDIRIMRNRYNRQKNERPQWAALYGVTVCVCILEAISAAINFGALSGDSDCGIPMLQWLRIFHWSFPLWLMVPGMMPIFIVCMSSILAEFFTTCCFWVWLLHMSVIGVRGFMMFSSNDNKCAADHAVAYYYMGFLLFLCIPMILLACILTIAFVFKSFQVCEQQIELNKSIASWTKYRREFKQWVGDNLEMFDAQKHKPGALVEEKEGEETYWNCNCKGLTAEELENKFVVVMPNCGHVHCQDCVMQHFQREEEPFSPCCGKLVIKLQE